MFDQTGPKVDHGDLVNDPELPPPNKLRVMHAELMDASPNAAAMFLISPRFQSERRRVFFYNAHCANIRAKDSEYADALARADYVLPDGAGIELAAKMTGKTLTANLNGTDFLPLVLALAARQGRSIFLMGGTPGTAERAAKHISSQISGLKIAGTRDGYDGAKDARGAIEAINRSGADILLVAMGVPLQELWLDRHAHLLHPRLCFAVGGLLDFWAGNVPRAPGWLRLIKGEWIWRLAMEPRRMWKRYLLGNISFLIRAGLTALRQVNGFRAAKRGLDLVLAGSALFVLGPLLILLCGLIRLESRGAAIFSQRRIGQDGKPFMIYKLRSMRQDAEAGREALLATSDRKGVCFKSRRDPRITRIGCFLRRISLDELPQLVNVLKGEMSIVGPRPALPEEVAAYDPDDRARLYAKPGLTGLWQVSGRADVDFKRMVALDISYAQSRSLLLDFLLIAATFRAVMSGKGAY